MKLSKQAIQKICTIVQIADENWDTKKLCYVIDLKEIAEKLAELNLINAPMTEIGKRYTVDNLEVDIKE